jgi:hypothetical protein
VSLFRGEAMFIRMDIEGMPEAKRLARLEELEPQRPGLAKLVGGVLTGRATPERPNVPIWDYLQFAADHPEVTLDELIEIRFPVNFLKGEDFTIDPAAESLRTDPVPPPVPETLDSVIERWKALHTAGVVEWNIDKRAVEMIRPMNEYKRVLDKWGAERRWKN